MSTCSMRSLEQSLDYTCDVFILHVTWQLSRAQLAFMLLTER